MDMTRRQHRRSGQSFSLIVLFRRRCWTNQSLGVTSFIIPFTELNRADARSWTKGPDLCQERPDISMISAQLLIFSASSSHRSHPRCSKCRLGFRCGLRELGSGTKTHGNRVVTTLVTTMSRAGSVGCARGWDVLVGQNRRNYVPCPCVLCPMVSLPL